MFIGAVIINKYIILQQIMRNYYAFCWCGRSTGSSNVCVTLQVINSSERRVKIVQREGRGGRKGTTETWLTLRHFQNTQRLSHSDTAVPIYRCQRGDNSHSHEARIRSLPHHLVSPYRHCRRHSYLELSEDSGRDGFFCTHTLAGQKRSRSCGSQAYSW